MSTAEAQQAGRPTASRRVAAWLLALAVAAVPALPAGADPQGATDRASVEGAFLVNFVRFTHWPPARFDDAASPYTITVVGSQGVADAVRAVAEAAGQVQGRRIVVRRVRGRDVDVQRHALRASHLVFMHRSAGVPAEDVVEAVAGAAVLTVGDSAGFVQAGGMLAVVPDGSRMAFVANADAIRRGGVDVSAKVMKLARDTRP